MQNNMNSNISIKNNTNFKNKDKWRVKWERVKIINDLIIQAFNIYLKKVAYFITNSIAYNFEFEIIYTNIMWSSNKMDSTCILKFEFKFERTDKHIL